MIKRTSSVSAARRSLLLAILMSCPFAASAQCPSGDSLWCRENGGEQDASSQGRTLESDDRAYAADAAPDYGVRGGQVGGGFSNRLDRSGRPLETGIPGTESVDASRPADRYRNAYDRSLESQQRGRRAREISQFQRFVQQSTGRLLPIYGQALFDTPQITYVPDNDAPAPDDHVLGPGDEIRLHVWGAVDYDGRLVIDRNGQVSIPRAGVVNLAGVRVRDVESVLRAQIGKTFTNFNLNASPGRLSSIQIYVVGHAEQPGTYNISSLSTMVNALFVSGGPSASGSMRDIQLKRNGEVISTLDLYDFIGKGDRSRDVHLLPGDVIVIPPVGPRVAITGALDNAAIFELEAGQDAQTTLGELLALGGGVPTLAKPQKALLERIDHDQQAPREVKEIALDASGLQEALRDGDVVTLLDISPAFANAVTLQGNVASPLRYRWFSGMRVRDLIPEREALITPDYYRRKNLLVQSIGGNEDNQARGDSGFSGASYPGDPRMPDDQRSMSPPYADDQVLPGSQRGSDSMRGSLGAAGRPLTGTGSRAAPSRRAGSEIDRRVRNMVDQINWDYAVIERLDRDRLRTRLIPFNLGRAVLEGDETQNLELEPGDVVTILSQHDLKLPLESQTRLVRVEGEVAAPGVYEAKPGETLEQLIERVGGLTPQAYLYGTEVERVSVREKQQQDLDMLIRRMEQQQQSQVLFMMANRTSSADAAAQAALIQQQQQLARSQLESLRTLRSNGRIALELDPKRVDLAALPDLQLEDGDRIFVPPVPGFVTVVGAVDSENVFIYKPGRTVGDVTKVAGLREEADLDHIFVLRADGSIVSRAQSGFFRSFSGMKLMPGDTVVVPEKLDRETTRNFVARQLKDWTQILSQFGLGVAAIKVIRDL